MVKAEAKHIVHIGGQLAILKRLAKTNFKMYEKFCWDGTKVRGAFRVKNTENHIDKIISGATQIAAKV